MRTRITVIDYNCDWILKDHNLVARSTPGELTREQVIEFLGTLDVDGIELVHGYWQDYSVGHLKKLVDDCGLPIVCYIFFVDLAQPRALRSDVVDHVKAMVDRIAELGAPFGMIVPGIAKDEFSLDQQRAWMIDGLRHCAEHAAQMSITLLAENIDDPPARPLMGRAPDCVDVCAEVNSPAFRLIYDAGATMILHEDPIEALRTMAPYIAHVHVKNDRRVGPLESVHRCINSEQAVRYTGTNLDEGEADLKPVLRELDRLGYDGAIAIEYQGEGDPRKTLPHNVQCLRQLLGCDE